MNSINTQSGLSIVATILALLIFSLFIAVAVSLVTTGAHIGVQETQGQQAFDIADGGLHYTLAENKNDIPNYSTNGAWIPLGAGTFKVDTPAYLTNAVNSGDPAITVISTASFPTAGRITIDTDFNITYTGTNPTQFTGVTVTTSHAVNNSVYPSARLYTTIANDPSCTSPINIDVNDPAVPNDTGGFQIPGIIFIDTEYFYCAGPADPNTFQSCTRCYLGSSPSAHPVGRYASQYILTSTGRITNIISSNVQRVVNISAGPEEH